MNRTLTQVWSAIVLFKVLHCTSATLERRGQLQCLHTLYNPHLSTSRVKLLQLTLIQLPAHSLLKYGT